MFKNRIKGMDSDDREMILVGSIFASLAVAITVLGAVAFVQDSKETQEAIKNGRRVYHIAGQKVIV